MRIRPLAAVSVTVLAALALAGCAGSGTPDSSASASTAGNEICSAAVPAGASAEAVTIDGEFGQTASATFTAPLEVEEAARHVLIEGEGAAIANGDYVSYALAVFDATTGESLQQGGFGENGLPATPITIGSGADAYFGCANEGSRIVVTTPATDGVNPLVYVIDVREVTPESEWCTVGEPGEIFPTVEFSEAGIPTIAIPTGDAPDGVQLEVLEEGDGAVVETGDNVTVNYTGVRWSDGVVFDSSFDRGAPETFPTTGVVAGFKRALEGQKVGSTVVVSMSPACGYGEVASEQNAQAGQTLVFVVDIIETAKQ